MSGLLLSDFLLGVVVCLCLCVITPDESGILVPQVEKPAVTGPEQRLRKLCGLNVLDLRPVLAVPPNQRRKIGQDMVRAVRVRVATQRQKLFLWILPSDTYQHRS